MWGTLWRSKNKRDGVTEHLLYDECKPVIFRTQREANEWIRQKYGYISVRKDLRGEPHGWRMPKPIRVKVKAEK